MEPAEQLDEHWEERIIPNDKINQVTLIALAPLAAAVAVPFGLIHGRAAVSAGFSWLVSDGILFVAILLGSIIVHEGLHALGWVLFGGLPLKEIKFGILKGNPYTHAKLPMPARGYQIGGGLPGFVLGVVPGLVSWFNGSGKLMIFASIMLATAAGDAIMLWLLRDVPPDRLVQDHPSAIGCLVMKEPPAG